MLTLLNTALAGLQLVVLLVGVFLALEPSTRAVGLVVVALGLGGLGLGLAAALRAWRFRADSLVLGRVGHELRTPLAVMAAWLDQFSAPASDEAPDPAVLDRQVRRMRVMVEGTLHGARKLGRSRPASVPCLRRGGTGVRLSAVAADLTRLWPGADAVLVDRPAGGIAEPRLVWTQDDLGDLAQAPGDDRFHHIVANLVQNAFRHGIPRARPLVRPWKVEVRVGIRSPGLVEVVVEDEGPGVRRHPLTGALQSLDPQATRNPGTGLGFFLVRELTESAGGTLSVGPCPGGRGTRVTVLLPLEEEAPWPRAY